MATPIALFPFDGSLVGDGPAVTAPATTSGPLRYQAGHRSGTQALVVAGAGTNHVSNPSAEVGVDPWNRVGGVGVALPVRTTEDAWVGSAAIRADAPSSVTGDRGVGLSAAALIAAAPGETWAASAQVKGPDGLKVAIEMIEYDTATRQVVRSAPVTMTGAWQRVWVAGQLTLPTLTKTGPRIVTADPVTATFLVDGVQMEKSPVPTAYFDGSLGAGYAWTGTAHASISTRAATTLQIPLAQAPASLIVRYSPDGGASWAVGYTETFSDAPLGPHATLARDGTTLTVSATASVVLGPVMAFSDTLTPQERDLYAAKPWWALVETIGYIDTLPSNGARVDAPVLVLP